MTRLSHWGLGTLTATLVGLSATWYASAREVPAETANRVCGDNLRYAIRRLGSDQVEDICATYRGKVVLVVNTASRCAFTDQYQGLEKLYSDYRDRGLVVIGFPSNDFAGQEPDSEQTIKNFCRMTYGVQFPMYTKIRVVGDDAEPFYKALANASGSQPRWNFHKYLIDRGGRLIRSFSADTPPESDELIDAIEQLL